jgi:hypothetical protein
MGVDAVMRSAQMQTKRGRETGGEAIAGAGMLHRVDFGRARRTPSKVRGGEALPVLRDWCAAPLMRARRVRERPLQGHSQSARSSARKRA